MRVLILERGAPFAHVGERLGLPRSLFWLRRLGLGLEPRVLAAEQEEAGLVPALRVLAVVQERP